MFKKPIVSYDTIALIPIVLEILKHNLNISKIKRKKLHTMIPDETLKTVIDKGIEDFSQSYIDKLNTQNTFTIEDIKTAFVEGAQWMQGFIEVTKMMQGRL